MIRLQKLISEMILYKMWSLLLYFIMVPGHYGDDFDEPFNITLPDFSLGMDWLLEGTFFISLSVYNDQGLWSCLQFVVEMMEKQSSVSTTPVPGDHCDLCQTELDSRLQQMLSSPLYVDQREFLLGNDIY